MSHAALVRRRGGVYRRLLKLQEAGRTGLWSDDEVG